MVDASIDAVAGIGGTVPRPGVVATVWRRLRRLVVRTRAEVELSCIDERLREDAGLTPDAYVEAALRRVDQPFTPTRRSPAGFQRGRPLQCRRDGR